MRFIIVKKFDVARIITPDLVEAIESVIDYSLPSEKADYEDQDPGDRAGHIYERLVALRAWLDQEATVEHILENTGSTPDSYTLERFYRHNGRTLRVVIVRDDYETQSRAVVEASMADGSFGQVMKYPASNWYSRTSRCSDEFDPRGFEAGFAALRLVADEMAARAMLILPA
jgi:hypothetical protein